MEVFFKPTFLKDFKALPPRVKRELRYVCTEVFPNTEDIRNLSAYDIKPLRGFVAYYRLRMGEYRVGFKREGRKVIFMRVRNRKDVYKSFP
jgi:mRNA-degrading endonuclease RelE of RelBE toxin-antitoxin system